MLTTAGRGFIILQLGECIFRLSDNPAARPIRVVHVAWAIMQYEPRLTDVRVTHAVEAGSPLALTFRITGTMRKDDLVAPFSVGIDVCGSSELRLQRVV